MIKFSVIVCTYNRSDFLIRVLECLRNQIFNKDEFEIVLINNNSTDNTEQICREFINLNKSLKFIYFLETNKGLSYARNKGIELSKGKWIIFLDDDAEPIKEYIFNISVFLKEKKDCIAAGGRIYPKYETDKPKWMSKFLLPLVSAIDLGNKVKKFPLNKYPIGANMIFKKEIFNKIGYFNTDLGRMGNQLLGGEEKEIFMKLREISNQIYYIPDAIVYHFIPENRVKLEFIKKIAQKIGESNLIIYKNKGISKLILSEVIKWGVSILLFLYYLSIFQYDKGIMLLKFRFFILRGILFVNRD